MALPRPFGSSASTLNPVIVVLEVRLLLPALSTACTNQSWAPAGNAGIVSVRIEMCPEPPAVPSVCRSPDGSRRTRFTWLSEFGGSAKPSSRLSAGLL